jgi:class 3 adenylate cyclase
VPDDVRERIVDPDAQLTAAFAESGRSVLPADFSFDRPPGSRAHFAAVMQEIDGNVELTLEDVNARLAARHAAPAQEDEFREAMRETSFHRLQPLFNDGKAPSFDDASVELLPNLSRRLFGGSVQGRLLEREYNKFVAWRTARRLFAYVPDGVPALLKPTDEQLPLPEFGRSMLGCGFVTEAGQSVIRSRPLYAEYQGQLVPDWGLAVALAYLGVRPEQVRVSPDRIVIPGARPAGDGGDIVIPIHNEDVPGYGPCGGYIDVPLTGTADWRTMYDYPRHADVRQHYRITAVTALRALRLRIRQNNELADKAIHDLFGPASEEVKAYESRQHDFDAPDGMAAEVAKAADAIKMVVDADKNLSPEQFEKLAKVDKDQYRAARVLPEIPKQNAAFVPLIAQSEAELRRIASGKAVFIGMTATATDLRPTVLHARCPGVVVHGALFNAVMTGYFWRRLPEWATLLCTIGVGAAATVTACYLSPMASFLCTMLVGLGYALVNALLVFGQARGVLGMAGPLTAVFLIWAFIPIVRYLVESSQRARIQRRFSAYVDPALVHYLIDHPEKLRLAGELKEVTVVFSDLAGFTTLTEKMRERAVEILGEYMALVVPLIRSHRGYVSKFVGDGLMFFYGAPIENPDQAIDAVNTAMEMLTVVDEFATALTRRGLDKLGLRIGINTATMVVGDTGIDTAADYTPLGDGMNFGSRLEGANKMFGTRVLISARTVYLLDGRYLVRKIANLIVKGKTEAVMAYEPLCRAEQACETQQRLADVTDAMVDAYIAGEWERCIAIADEIDREFGKGKLTACYREKSENCLRERPTQFNGTIVLSEK